MQNLGTLGGKGSRANAINDEGVIAGSAGLPLFDSSGEGDNIDLGGDNSYALSINDNGQIVGCSSTPSFAHTAMIFDPAGSGYNIDLNTVIDPAYSGPHLQLALDINNNGWIVGVAGEGVNSRGFLLTPIPEPSALTLILLGDMAMTKRRKQ